IFLSHCSKDKAIVRRIADELNQLGLDGWLDEWELEVGDSLHESLGKALEWCKYIGVVITPAFLESQWCMQELRQALSREMRQGSKVVLPLLAERAVPPPFLEDRIYVDFTVQYYAALTRLCAILHGFPPKNTARAFEKSNPKSITDARSILRELGW